MHHYPPLHPKSSLFIHCRSSPKLISVCRGLRWHRLFVCLSLLALVLHRDKGYCQCSHKNTLALGPPYFLTLFMPWYRPAPSPAPTAAHDTDGGRMPSYTGPPRLTHLAAAAALLRWHVAVFQIWHM